jgi:hypothetical protein
MKIYDFSYYVKRRQAQQAATAVADVIPNMQKPGAVIELKRCVSDWFQLHQEISKHKKLA